MRVAFYESVAAVIAVAVAALMKSIQQPRRIVIMPLMLISNAALQHVLDDPCRSFTVFDRIAYIIFCFIFVFLIF